MTEFTFKEVTVFTVAIFLSEVLKEIFNIIFKIWTAKSDLHKE